MVGFRFLSEIIKKIINQKLVYIKINLLLYIVINKKGMKQEVKCKKREGSTDFCPEGWSAMKIEFKFSTEGEKAIITHRVWSKSTGEAFKYAMVNKEHFMADGKVIHHIKPDVNEW